MRSFVFIILLAAVVLAEPDAAYKCLWDAVKTPSLQDQARGTYDLRTVLTMYTSLSESTKTKLNACKVNLDSAMKKCEAANKPGACDQLTPFAVQAKCDSRFKRIGCCHCAMNCPSASWKEDEYHCTKPATSSQFVYVNQLTCGDDCEEINGMWVKPCGEGLKRAGLDKCIAVCPFGWHDEGARCRKPAVYRLAQPFFWTTGDN